jgi:hypothetical protein
MWLSRKTNRKTNKEGKEMSIIDKIDNYLTEGKAQELIKKYVKSFDETYGWEPHKFIDLTDMARRPEFRGIPFKDIQSAAKALAKKKFFNFDGFNKLTGIF